MFTPDEIALKRRQLASLREAHPQPAPHVAEVIARLERETATDEPQDITAPSVVDQLAAAESIIADLTANVERLTRERDAAKALNDGLQRQLDAKSKTTQKRKR